MIGTGHTCASRCRHCGALAYPATFVCSHCRGREFAHEPLAGQGTLVSWTRCHAVPAGFEQDQPLSLGVVDLEMGVRVLGQLAIDEPTTGMSVTLSVCVIRTLFRRPIQGLIFSARVRSSLNTSELWVYNGECVAVNSLLDEPRGER